MQSICAETKPFMIFLILLSSVFGGSPDAVLPGTIYTESKCRGGYLLPSCTHGLIQIINSTFGVASDFVYCDPRFTFCDVSTVINMTFHNELRQKCNDRSWCQVVASYGNIDPEKCQTSASTVVKVTYCCVSQQGRQCQVEKPPPWTDFPTPTTTEATRTTEAIAIGVSNAAVIGGVFGGFAGGALVTGIVILIVMKCKAPSNKKTKTPPGMYVDPSQTPPGVYYVKPVRDQDSHLYQHMDWPTRPYYNHSINYVDNNVNEARENDIQYEEIQQ